MTTTSHRRRLVATVDVRDLNTLRWGPLRQMFPLFVEDIELGRYLKKVLATDECTAVQIEPHLDSGGRSSTHVFDVMVLDGTPPEA
jgi:hypothetical protein